MSEKNTGPDDLDLEGLDPDNTAEQLHPSPTPPSSSDDGEFDDEPDYAENDG
jgi:hypothetical protein